MGTTEIRDFNHGDGGIFSALSEAASWVFGAIIRQRLSGVSRRGRLESQKDQSAKDYETDRDEDADHCPIRLSGLLLTSSR